MKIEKVNDHQIRCTLTREDLANRELKLSELAYGTDKAKELFRDMMQQAAYEFGFEAEDIPLMIEAVPINSECIVLIVTKVDDPEELDTRFSRFAPSVKDSTNEEEDENVMLSDDVMELFEQIHKKTVAKKPATDSVSSTGDINVSDSSDSTETDTTRVFLFNSLHQINTLARILGCALICKNTLYKMESTGQYLLLVYQEALDKETFGRICNTISEYGSSQKRGKIGRAYIEEHYTCILQNKALQTLASL